MTRQVNREQANRFIKAKRVMRLKTIVDMPIKKVRVYQNDVVTVREPINGSCSITEELKKTKRGKIIAMSTGSRRRLAFFLSNTGLEFGSMVTLTMPRFFPVDGKVFNPMRQRWLKNMNKYVRRVIGKEFFYVWFSEFQERGAIHWHVFVNVKSDWEKNSHIRFKATDLWLREVDKYLLELFSKTGISRDVYFETMSKATKFNVENKTWELLRCQDAATRYACLYASKPHQKTVPEFVTNIGRTWGKSKNLPIPKYTEFELSQFRLVDWLKENDVYLDDYSDVPKVLWNLAPQMEDFIHGRTTGSHVP